MSYLPSSGVGKLRITMLVVPDRQKLGSEARVSMVISHATVVIRTRMLDLLQTVVSDQTNIMVTWHGAKRTVYDLDTYAFHVLPYHWFKRGHRCYETFYMRTSVILFGITQNRQRYQWRTKYSRATTWLLWFRWPTIYISVLKPPECHKTSKGIYNYLHLSGATWTWETGCLCTENEKCRSESSVMVMIPGTRSNRSKEANKSGSLEIAF